MKLPENSTTSSKEIIPSERAARVLTIANAAGEILMRYRGQPLPVEHKKDAFDPVTAADRDADEFIRSRLHEAFPGDHVISEEHDDVHAAIPDAGRIWMVDPLNGTKSFIRGADTFAVVIGLVENGAPVFGCVAVPARQEVFYAEKGGGAFRNVGGSFTRMHASLVSDIAHARLITREPSGEARPIEERLNRLPFAERIAQGSGAKLCAIAAGEAEAHINTNSRASKWDIAAPQIILEEAGGVVTDLDGQPITYDGTPELVRSFVASANAELHEEILRSLRLLGV